MGNRGRERESGKVREGESRWRRERRGDRQCFCLRRREMGKREREMGKRERGRGEIGKRERERGDGEEREGEGR